MTKPPRLSRRRVVLGSLAAAVASGGVDALVVEPRWLEVTRRRVDVPDLSTELEGFTIAHVTDVHLRGAAHVHDAIADELARARPDLVAVTGDVVDSDAHVAFVAPFVDKLRASGARVVATLGNWEHWGQVDLGALEAAYARGGARLLVNESLDVERGLSIVATDDSCSGYADVARAARDARPDATRLLLSHAPGFFDAAAIPERARAALSLSGHTHGGQIRALTRAIYVPPGSGRFVAGAYDTPAGPLYVSRGIGASVVPARLCCRPELAIFVLGRGERAAIV